ncbi:MAG: hypothetical protein L0Y74_08665, partial [candidate division Zixibacteria bacterium]|nr:hypothetical protein [candidate division Zixibacteria bacterium]
MFGRIWKAGWIFIFTCVLAFDNGLLRAEEAVDPHPGEAYTESLTPIVKTTGTTYGVALYACSTGTSPNYLPSWWRKLWDPTVHPSQRSVARYYKDNSRGVYQLNITPIGKPDSTYIVSSRSPGVNPVNSDSFAYDVVVLADTLLGVNFANFDNDGPNGIPASQDICDTGTCMSDGKKGDDDGYVDAVFVLADGLVLAQYLWVGLSDYVTRDTAANGQHVKVHGSRGARSCGGEFYQLCAYSSISHDWGHVLGLEDYFSLEGQIVSEQNNWRRLGSFSMMGNPHWIDDRESPFDPYSQIKLGWVSPSSIVTVDTPLYQTAIPNFMTTGTVYKLKRNSGEYFLVTNHTGVNPTINEAGYHEGTYRGFGVLIWHIDSTGTSADRRHKLFDLELAHGLWNFHPDSFTTTTPNPVYGKDSLDIWYRPGTLINMGYAGGHPAQSFTCFWNDSTKRNFDGMSNPSSDGYRDSVIDYIRVQDIPTLIGVRNINSPEPFTTATADLLTNSWYGSIRQNTTWGPGTISVVGDVVVDAGLTLTIQPGTTIKFRKNFDEMQSGVTTKSELVVKGTLTCLGTQANPITFTSSATTPSNSDWGGVVIDTFGRANFEFTVFKYADTALAIRGDTATVVVYNSTFKNFDKAGVSSRSAKTRLGGIVPVPNPPDCG